MSDAATTKRVDEILEKVSALSISGNLQDAANVVREAITLDPENPKVKAAWDKLRSDDSKSQLLQFLDIYLKNGDEESLLKAVRAAGSPDVTQNEARKAIADIFACEERKNGVLEDVLYKLLSTRSGKVALVTRLKENTDGVIQRGAKFPKGAVLVEIVNILLDSSAWDSQQLRDESERTAFTTLIRLIQEPNQPIEVFMHAISKLLAIDAKKLGPVLNPEAFDFIVSLLDIRRPLAVRSQATLATAKLLEVNPDQEKAQASLKDFVVSRIGRAKANDMVIAFSAAAAMFPILPALAANLFLVEGFVGDVVTLAHRSTEQDLVTAVLELLSAACIDKACRQSIDRNCSQWLRALATAKGNPNNATTAALILSKTSDDELSKKNSLDELVNVFKTALGNTDSSALQHSVEGLAFMSIQPRIKDPLAKDQRFLKLLILTMSNNFSNQALVYGGITVFQNLIAYLPVLSAEEKHMDQLKAYANQSKPEAPDPRNTDEQVTARCRVVVDVGFVPLLVKALGRTNNSPTFLQMASNIFLSLTQEAKLRGRLVQQGLYDVVIRMANIQPKDDQALAYVQRQSAFALARLTIPINPALLFKTTTKRDPLLAIRPFSLLLDPPGANDAVLSGRNVVDHRPTFEALRALSNLAILDELTVQMIVDRCFDKIVELLWSRVSAICQAATECILNMTTEWSAVSKFVDEGAISRNRLHLLYALTTADAIGTRTAATAALSHILAAPDGVKAFAELKNGVEGLVEILGDGNADMRIRAAVCIFSLVAGEGLVGRKVRARVKSAGGIALLKKLSPGEEHKNMVLDALKCLETDRGISIDPP